MKALGVLAADEDVDGVVSESSTTASTSIVLR
jgi:hypothetical protein